LQRRGDAIVDRIVEHGCDASSISVAASEALPGAGSAPGITMPSIALVAIGDHLEPLRNFDPPVIARSRDSRTSLDLRSIAPDDDDIVVAALAAVLR
jgi:L-seryl-tRNA(Ser) seleniumtransferase